MEVPIINNLYDNGDRQRPKGKDVFKDQQKESEVNPRGVCVQSATTAYDIEAHWPCVCPCVLLLLGSFQGSCTSFQGSCTSFPCSESLSWLESMHAHRQRGRQTPRCYFGNRLL